MSVLFPRGSHVVDGAINDDGSRIHKDACARVEDAFSSREYLLVFPFVTTKRGVAISSNYQPVNFALFN